MAQSQSSSPGFLSNNEFETTVALSLILIVWLVRNFLVILIVYTVIFKEL